VPRTGTTIRIAAVAAFVAVVSLGAAVVVREMSGPVGVDRATPVEAPVTAARSCRRPYKASSPWNTPIAASAKYAPRTKAHVARLGDVLTSDPTQYTYPVYKVGPRTKRQVVQVNGVFSNVTSGGRRLRLERRGTVRLPIPPGARAAAGSDSQIVLVDSTTGDEWGAWQLAREGSGWSIENGYHYNVRWSGVAPRDPSGVAFGSRGAGVPYYAGLVRRCEIERGRIDHALAFAYTSPHRDHVFPATKSDGPSTNPADLPEGTRLRLDPRLTAAALRSRGCDRQCLIIAEALKKYGMYLIDVSGRPKVMLEYEGTAKWRGLVDANTVSPIPLSALKVLARSSSRP